MITDDIKKLANTDRLVVGTALTLKGLKQGLLERVYLTTNCPSGVQEDLNHYAKLSGAEVVQSGVENEELGIICKRRHAVSVLGVKKAK